MPTEAVPRCPVCGLRDAPILYTGLRDVAFGVADGTWTMRRCTCGAAFLDPRPTSEAIPGLYASYYTHSDLEPRETVTGMAAVLRKLRNGYVNRRHGFDLQPAWALTGSAVGTLVPPLGAIMSRAVRSLPAGSRVLDVGCGDGQFVAEANAAGMVASGLELDERVVNSARAAGLDVRLQDLTEVARLEPGTYDAVTMSHLVEHLPDPVAFLRAAHTVLRRGGLIWIATPNVGGAGHQQFGRHWRGLEPPRHLVVFDEPSLENALHAAGFSCVQPQRATPVSWYGQARSANGRAGRVPTDRLPLRRRDRLAGLVTDLRAQFVTTVSDELLLMARAE